MIDIKQHRMGRDNWHSYEIDRNAAIKMIAELAAGLDAGWQSFDIATHRKAFVSINEGRVMSLDHVLTGYEI